MRIPTTPAHGFGFDGTGKDIPRNIIQYSTVRFCLNKWFWIVDEECWTKRFKLSIVEMELSLSLTEMQIIVDGLMFPATK